MATVMPNSDDVGVVIANAQSEAQLLLQRRAEITKRLTAIRRTISDLAKVFGHDVAVGELITATWPRPRKRNRHTGLTGQCRAELLKTETPLTALALVTKIQASNPELINHHKDPIASVTAILLRLESYGEATSETCGSRRRLWKAKTDQRPSQT